MVHTAGIVDPKWWSRRLNYKKLKHFHYLTVISKCEDMLMQSVKSKPVLQVSHGRLATARKPERQVTRMVVVMIVAFMVAWTPYATFAILVTIHPTIELDPRLASIPAFFSKTAAVYNPVIYVFMNKQVILLLLFHRPFWFCMLLFAMCGDTSQSTIDGFILYFCGCCNNGWHRNNSNVKLSIHDAGK